MRSRCRHHLVNALERTQQTSLLRLRPQPLGHRSCAQRCYATAVARPDEDASQQSQSLLVPSEARYSEIGVQHVSRYVHQQLFPGRDDQVLKPDPELVELSKRHLARHELLGKTGDQVAPIGFDLPELKGASLDEHFYKLGMDSAEPYMTMAKEYVRASLPPRPRKWAQKSGWTKYEQDGTWTAIDAPDADVLTFDTEVMWHETNFPAMACAASAQHWYAWISPWLLGESEDDRHLIPFGDPHKSRIVVGHNIGYDRARIAEEYDLQQSKTFFMDTMSLHVAANGMCSQQRPGWMKARKLREDRDRIANDDSAQDLASLLEGQGGEMEEEEEMWVGRSSANSLRDVAKFHCNITIDKAQREWFGELDREGIVERLDELLDYCAADVDVTHKVYKRVFPTFLQTCPHPVSFAALRHLATEILPVNKTWDSYIANAEATYHKLSSGVEERLADLAKKALEHKDDADFYQNDPWLSQLDWGGQQIKMVKGKKKGDPSRPAARQKLPGMPNWYRDLFPRKDAGIALTVRTRIAPLLLRLAWDGHPLIWSDKYGWSFKVRHAEAAKYRESAMTEIDTSEDDKLAAKHDMDHAYFKLPHPGGPWARCTSPIAKGYQQFFDTGTLASEYEYAREALDMNASCSYWISARDRIKSQMVVYEKELAGSTAQDTEQGYILPQIIPMGTITRRAVENTWLTAANAKKNRVGSELKSIVKAPPGYAFIGADVDSQELWIASLVGDASFKLHGGNAIGFMTLEGTKAAGTDLHSKTAKILGISRNDAKVFNYGRIYGAGRDFAKSLLRRFNPTLKEEDADRIGKQLYKETKGERTNRKVLHERRFWRGGTESLVFNRLEDFAEQEKPRTPVLGAGITEALMRRFIGKSQYLTSRINWAIQSSGVDYLHLLIVSMDYLCRRYNIAARLALTVHDEIRYLAQTDDKYRCAMALQVANVWTRAMFSEQMGIPDLPQSCAYFSAVDIDHVLRKEVDMDCITPSHPERIPPGESLDITQILAKGAEARLDPAVEATDPPKPERFDYVQRIPVMEALDGSADDGGQAARRYLRAQIAEDVKEVNAIVKEINAKPRTLKQSLENGTEKKSRPRAGPPKTAPAHRTFASSSSAAWIPVDAEYNNGRTANFYDPAKKDLRKVWRKQASFQDNGRNKRKAVGGNTAVDVGLMAGRFGEVEQDWARY